MGDEARSQMNKPVLQKPPGFGGPPRPPPKKSPLLPQTFRQLAGKPITRRQQQRKSVCRRRLCCYFCILIVCLVFLIALFGAVSYLYYQPRFPAFRLQAVQTPRFNATTRPDGSGTFLDAVVIVKIFVSNPNGKIVFTYGESDAEVYIADEDGDVAVGSGSASGFVEGRKNATVMRFSAEAKGALVDDAVGARLRSRFRSKEIRIGVEVSMRIGIVGGRRTTWRVPMRVDCPPVSLKAVKGGAGLPKCDVYLFTWINLH